MGKRLVAHLLFTFTLMFPSFALPFNMRINVDHTNDLSSSVSTGIIIALFVLFLIPLLWCVYKMGTRTRNNPRPLFAPAPPIFPTTPYNGPAASGQISRPHPVHKKMSRPTSRASS